jgi:hypothetical protein
MPMLMLRDQRGINGRGVPVKPARVHPRRGR